MWILLERIVVALGVVVLGEQALRLAKGKRLDLNRLYKKKEVASILEITETEVGELIKNGQLQNKIVGEQEYISGRELDRFLA